MDLELKYSLVKNREAFFKWIREDWGISVRNLDALYDVMSEDGKSINLIVNQENLIQIVEENYSYRAFKMLFSLAKESDRLSIELL